jgi:hypothetical protein
MLTVDFSVGHSPSVLGSFIHSMTAQKVCYALAGKVTGSAEGALALEAGGRILLPLLSLSM